MAANQYPAAFVYAIELAERLCLVMPLNLLPGCWEYTFGKTTLKVNGHNEERDGVPPYSVSFYVNGWPAGTVDSGGGCVVGVDEDELNAVLKAECDRVRQMPEVAHA